MGIDWETNIETRSSRSMWVPSCGSIISMWCVQCSVWRGEFRACCNDVYAWWGGECEEWLVCTLMTGEVKGRDCLISIYPFCAFYYLLVRKCLILCGIKQIHTIHINVATVPKITIKEKKVQHSLVMKHIYSYKNLVNIIYSRSYWKGIMSMS